MSLVQLVQQSSMLEVAQESMDALLTLHQPEIIDLWNPESPDGHAFWIISSNVLYSIAQRLTSRHIMNFCEVLRWLKEILICRNNYLKQRRDRLDLTGLPKIWHQALIKLEVVFFFYLWSLDIDAVLTSMSCFRLLCEEAELRSCYDDVVVEPLMPNYEVYASIAESSHTIMTTGRAHLQKQIMALLRRITHQTPGNAKVSVRLRFSVLHGASPSAWNS